MSRRLAVAVIHGMGAQRKTHPDDSAAPSFSADLRKRLRVEMGEHRFDAEVAWREVFWAKELQDRQDAYAAAMRRVSRFGPLRRFVMHRLADAAAYYPSKRSDSTYEKVHRRIDRVIEELEADVAPDAPLLIAAHSLGGHMMSNYIWDLQAGHRTRPTAFQRLESLGGMLTFGCNIPVFIFSHGTIEAIAYPGADRGRMVRPWWRNYYDADDPLGYPLTPVGGGYAALAGAGEMQDYRINAGSWLLHSWNFLSHNGYWDDRGFARRVAAFIDEIMAA
ncbi:MAG: hypothetical protein QNJ16_13235 [Rhodobacter sp.]|nr:hypothetical protein [Rhodobacter sp.]